MNHTKTWMRRTLRVLALLGLLGVGGAWGQDRLGAPEIAENGASVRVFAAFSPALVAGDSFILLVNGKQVLTGTLAQGALSSLSTNVIATASLTNVGLSISSGGRIKQAAQSFQVTLPGSTLPPDPSPITTNSVRVRQDAQNIRMQFTRETPFVGVLTLSDATFSLRVASDGGLSKNSFLSASGNFTNQLALAFEQVSNTQTRDDPKVFGRGARGT